MMIYQETAAYVKANFSRIKSDPEILVRLQEIYRRTFGEPMKADCDGCIKKGFDRVMNHYELS